MAAKRLRPGRPQAADSIARVAFVVCASVALKRILAGWSAPHSLLLERIGVGNQAEVFPWLSGKPPLLARGVGAHDPDSFPFMGRTGRAKAHHDRPSGVADFRQAREDPVRAASSEARNVLKCEPSGSQLSGKSNGFSKEACVRPVGSLALVVGRARVLTRRGSAQKPGRGDPVSAEPSGSKGSDVVIDRNFPAALIGLAAPGIGLARRDGADAGSVKSEDPAPSRAAEKVDRGPHGCSPFRYWT